MRQSLSICRHIVSTICRVIEAHLRDEYGEVAANHEGGIAVRHGGQHGVEPLMRCGADAGLAHALPRQRSRICHLCR